MVAKFFEGSPKVARPPQLLSTRRRTFPPREEDPSTQEGVSVTVKGTVRRGTECVQVCLGQDVGPPRSVCKRTTLFWFWVSSTPVSFGPWLSESLGSRDGRVVSSVSNLARRPTSDQDPTGVSSVSKYEFLTSYSLSYLGTY